MCLPSRGLSRKKYKCLNICPCGVLGREDERPYESRCISLGRSSYCSGGAGGCRLSVGGGIFVVVVVVVVSLGCEYDVSVLDVGWRRM